VISGGAGDLGSALAGGFATLGDHVMLLDANGPGVERVAAALSAKGLTCTAEVVDLCQPDAVAEVIARTAGQHGSIDVLVNCAAIMDGFRSCDRTSPQLWNAVLQINLTAPFLLCRNVLPVMARQQRGAIVNVASVAGFRGGVSGAAYAASKHGLIGLTRNIAWHHRSSGIRCNAVCPGGIERPPESAARRMDEADPEGLAACRPVLGAMVRMTQEREIVDVVTFLASERASSMNGSVLTADAGWSAA